VWWGLGGACRCHVDPAHTRLRQQLPRGLRGRSCWHLPGSSLSHRLLLPRCRGIAADLARPRPLARLGTVLRLVVVAALTSGIDGRGDNGSQVSAVLAVLLLYVLGVLLLQPFSSALVGGLELLATLACAASCCGLLVVIGGDGSDETFRRGSWECMCVCGVCNGGVGGGMRWLAGPATQEHVCPRRCLDP
jgi:hypothetical protein